MRRESGFEVCHEGQDLGSAHGPPDLGIVRKPRPSFPRRLAGSYSTAFPNALVAPFHFCFRSTP